MRPASNLDTVDRGRSIEETAQILRMSPSQLRSLVKAGKGPKVTKLSERVHRIFDSDREAWVRKLG